MEAVIETLTPETFEHPTGKLWLNEQGIIHICHHAGVALTGDDVRAYLAAARRLTGGHKAPLLVDRRRPYSHEFTAMLTIRAIIHDHALAVAFVVSSHTSYQVARFSVEMELVGVPGAVFFSEQAALAWLREYLCAPAAA